MTLFVEVSGPILWKPFRFSSASMFRVGWLFFAVGWLRVPFKEFSKTSYYWSKESPVGEMKQRTKNIGVSVVDRDTGQR